MDALRRAEEKKGSPPYVLEIEREWSSMIPMLAGFFLMMGLQELQKNDECLSDINNERWSLRPELQSTKENPTDFMLFSDRFAQVFPTYELDDMCRIRPGPDTPRVNFTDLKELLLSKDLSRNEELSWVSPMSLRFLDGQDIIG